VARVMVQLPDRSYPVIVAQNALQELPQLLSDLSPTGAALVTDTTVGPLWAEPVLEGIRTAGLTCAVHAVEPGEEAKTWPVLERVLAFFEDIHLDRQGVVLALGGGVVGDLAGFAAAIWLRGVRYVQIPTTLLAMVDSSIGGKTAINMMRAKNMIGAFWQPIAAISDLSLLKTLPEEALTSAFAEIVKYGLSLDAGLTHTLQVEREGLQALRSESLEPVITRCVELKAAIVAADERERGQRAILNYGHTTGHAIEVASGFQAVHGRAVAQGMRVAVRLGLALGMCDDRVVKVHDDLLAAYRLPGQLPEVPPDAVLAALPRDKKVSGGRIGWVLPEAIGKAKVGVKVPPEIVEQTIRQVLTA
jgi:3-dehydroquinate synthase